MPLSIHQLIEMISYLPGEREAEAAAIQKVKKMKKQGKKHRKARTMNSKPSHGVIYSSQAIKNCRDKKNLLREL